MNDEYSNNIGNQIHLENLLDWVIPDVICLWESKMGLILG